MKLSNFRGELTDILAKIEALVKTHRQHMLRHIASEQENTYVHLSHVQM